MADQSDVEQTLVTIVSGVIYPLGINAPSLVGRPCRVHRGWPNAATLDVDLLAGRVTVTVTGEQQGLRNTTRYPDEWRPLQTVAPTLTASVNGPVATFAGSATLGQLAGILANQVAAVHRTTSTDTPATVATALAAALAGVGGALSGTVANGAAVRVSGVSSIVARIDADQPSIRETRRQLQVFRVICWCPDPATRDQVATAIDTQLATFDFLGLSDGMAGRLRYIGTTSSDRVQDAALYRRDLIYTMDYATTLAADLPRMLFGETQVAGDGVIVKTILS